MQLSIIKRVAVGLTAGLLALAPFATKAVSNWGPNRTLKNFNQDQTGFDYVTFNSFTNTDVYGNEPTFFDGKDAAVTTPGGFNDVVDVTHAQEVMLRIYVHNGAKDSLNASGDGIARNTKVRVELPSDQGRSLRANAFISASNADPGTVFDSFDMQTVSPSDFSVSYVPGSARIINNATGAAGRSVSDDIVGRGALIGYDSNDGNMPGCFQYDALVSLKVKVNFPSISIQKQVTTPGSTNWQEELRGVKPGDTVSWLLTYDNTSKMTVDDVTIRDQMPAHLELVPGSITWVDSNHPNGEQLADTVLGSGGFNAGRLGVNGGGYIRFRTVVKNDFAATECGDIALTNQGFARAKNINETSDTAKVVVNRVCQTPPPPTPPVGGGQLPQAGVETAAAGALGTGAMGYGLRAYLRSRRSLLAAIKGVK